MYVILRAAKRTRGMEDKALFLRSRKAGPTTRREESGGEKFGGEVATDTGVHADGQHAHL